MSNGSPTRRALVLFFFFFAILATSVERGGAQASAFDRDDYAAPVGARGIVAADLNGDGWVDLALANTQPGTVAVLLNRGAAAGFAAARTVPTPGGPFDITSGDFDGDGRVDLAVANADANTIDVLLTGDASALSWAPKSFQRLPAVGNPRGITSADLDRDGALDLVFTAFYQNATIVLFGSGTGTFSSRGLPAAAAGTRPQGVAAADLNNDGHMDLVVANTGASPLTALYGNGAGAFTRRNVDGPQQLNVVTAGDFDGDGWADVAAASTAHNTFTHWRGRSAGLSLAGGAQAGSSPRGIAAADFNGDGRQDLVVANRGDSTAAIALEGANGVYGVPEVVPAGYGSRAVAAADFNRDGRIDFATGNEFAGQVSVFRNGPAQASAAFAFERRELLPPSSGAIGVAVADLNHNDIPDIVSGTTVVLDGNPATARTLALPSGATVKDVAVIDVDRNGHTDVAVLFHYFNASANSLMDGYYMFKNDGTGAMTFAYGAGGFANSREFEVGDMNRDGWQDIVIASWSPANPNQSVLYVELIRTGRVLRQTLLTGRVHALALGDVNADGRLDVVLGLENPNSLTVEIGDGNGGFSNEAETSIALVPYDIAIADFTGDGTLDYIVTDDETVLALTGDGKGHYTDSLTYPARQTADGHVPVRTVLAADLTDDGLPDIVTGGGVLLRGTENGDFGPAAEFDWFWGSGAAFDTDADGDLDLVTNDGDYRPAYVFTNLRTSVNRAPVANAGPDRTVEYARQFYDQDLLLSARDSDDPDVHALQYEWRYNGELISRAEETGPVRLPPGTHTFELTVRDGRGGEARDTVTWTIPGFPEIVIQVAQSGTNPQGNWQLVSDPAAAGGVRVWDPNRNTAKVQAPLARPADYFVLAFTPDPRLEYKLWIRAKAENNHWSNDSVWVQFTGAVDAAGTPVYGIGTTSGLAVNLEECSGCGVSGWGWEDDGWGAVNATGVTLRFPEVKKQLLQIQTREDGISIDQVVLSASKYRTARPGTAKNDTTILEHTQRYW